MSIFELEQNQARLIVFPEQLHRVPLGPRRFHIHQLKDQFMSPLFPDLPRASSRICHVLLAGGCMVRHRL